jgi:hypothetical protein
MVEIPAKSRGGPPATAMAGPSRGASLCGIVPAANHPTRKLHMHMYACFQKVFVSGLGGTAAMFST